MRKWTTWFTLSLMALACAPETRRESADTDWWTEADRQFILSELDRTTVELESEITGLSDNQWNFHEALNRWTMGEIVEHLEMQNQLHYREISVTANGPQYLAFRTITKDQDIYFSNYSSDTTAGKAQWFLEPLGRFNSSKKGWEAFIRARSALAEFVAKTNIDLRKQFTYRTPVEGKKISDLKIGQVRDLHQLLLTGIAHTDRHLRQIRHIKTHPDYPK